MLRLNRRIRKVHIAMQNLTIFNPRPHIEQLRLPNGKSCFIIDDALLEPERLLQFATAQYDAFQPVDFNAYPGTYLLTPKEAIEALHDFFVQHVRRSFDARRVLSVHCRLSMVTLPPQTLRPYQWICHSDGQNIDPQQSLQASVLYLFKDESLGGTSFYEPARSPPETMRLMHDASTLPAQEFTQRYGIEPGYLTTSNEWFTHIGRVPAKWNRIIFYDGAMLHSGDIFAPEKLSADPRAGRLTLNGFFTSRRNAA
jgi:Family of unknown function (DUF6445)